MKFAKRLAALLLLGLGAPALLQATTLIKMSVEQMAESATDIVVGTVSNVRSVWVNRTLMTLTTVAVSESIKGSGGVEVTVVTPGGIDTDRAVPVAILYPGAPMLSPSEEVVLFLTSDESPVANAFTVVGYSQGKFSVVRDGADFTLAQGTTPDNQLPLVALKERVRDVVGKEGGEKHE